MDVGREDYVYVAENVDEVAQDVNVGVGRREGPQDTFKTATKATKDGMNTGHGEEPYGGSQSDDYDPRPMKYRNWPGYREHVYNATVKFCAESGMDIPMRHAFPDLEAKKHASQGKVQTSPVAAKFDPLGAEDLCGGSQWDDYDPRPMKYRNWPGYREHVYNATVKFCEESGMDIQMRHAFPDLEAKKHANREKV